MIRRLVACAALVALLCPFEANAADDDLEISFNDHCRECHSFVKDDNRLGPSLYGVVGRKAGQLAGFGYSESLKDSGVTWDEPTLECRDPRQPDEPALRGRRRCSDPQEDHRLSEDDLAGGR